MGDLFSERVNEEFERITDIKIDEYLSNGGDENLIDSYMDQIVDDCMNEALQRICHEFNTPYRRMVRKDKSRGWEADNVALVCNECYCNKEHKCKN